MLKISASPIGRTSLPRFALRLDAAATAISGLALVTAPVTIADLLGTDATFTVGAIGFGFFWPSAAWMFWASRRPAVKTVHLLVPMVFNAAWVLVSVAVLTAGVPDLPTGGKWFISVAAGIVAILADVEWVAWRRNRR